jgi:hypothetical protein
MGDTGPDGRAEILAISNRLESATKSHPDAETWLIHLDVIRAGTNNQPVSFGTAHGRKAMLIASIKLLEKLDSPHVEQLTGPGRTDLVHDVMKLVDLVKSQMPRRCNYCKSQFHPDRQDQTWCRDCRTGRGRLSSVEVALRCWWVHKHPIPSSLSNLPTWQEFRMVFYRRYDVRLGNPPAGNQEVAWSKKGVRREQDAWDSFWLWLRRNKPAASDDRDWRNEMLLKPIGDVAALLRHSNSLSQAAPAGSSFDSANRTDQAPPLVGVDTGGKNRKSKNSRVSLAEANLRAREALPTRKHWSQRSLAKAIGCAAGQVPNLPAYQAWRDAHLPQRPKAPQAISATDKVLNAIGKQDEELNRLIDEQKKDFEPSPLLPGRVRPQRKKL